MFCRIHQVWFVEREERGTAAPSAEFPNRVQGVTPYEVFTVAPNKRYRFRVINLASTECRYR